MMQDGFFYTLNAAATGSASGGPPIALDSLSNIYLILAQKYRIDPSLLHRVAVISSGTLVAFLIIALS